MKPQDKKVLELVKQVKESCYNFLKAVELMGNQCASTDRMVEKIIEDSKELEKVYNDQFKESK